MSLLAKSDLPAPALLLMPNVPKPLHGCAPRVMLGATWWNKQRKAAYEVFDLRCWSCGTHKTKAQYRQWLEAHESYNIDYTAGRMTLVQIVALCNVCHSFIHSGRLVATLRDGEIKPSKFWHVLHHGFSVLKAAGLPPNPFALEAAYQAMTHGIAGQSPAWTRVVEQKRAEHPIAVPEFMARWDKWRLVVGDRTFPPVFRSMAHWEEHFGAGV